MYNIIKTLGLTFSIAALITSVTPYFRYSFVAILASIIFLGLLFYLKSKTGKRTKFIQYISLLTLMAIGVTLYHTTSIETSRSENNPVITNDSLTTSLTKPKDSTLSK